MKNLCDNYHIGNPVVMMHVSNIGAGRQTSAGSGACEKVFTPEIATHIWPAMSSCKLKSGTVR
jgi:hypothetical protein